tara:strand:- start:11 stop:301 length:291 start_codon:yes stop_codon:yes gene_type:complete
VLSEGGDGVERVQLRAVTHELDGPLHHEEEPRALLARLDERLPRQREHRLQPLRHGERLGGREEPEERQLDEGGRVHDQGELQLERGRQALEHLDT